jgi:hypothetical protein
MSDSTSHPSSDERADDVVQRFHATNGRVPGYVGLAGAAVVLVLAVLARDTGVALAVGIGACLAAVLTWAVLLRPALWATEHHLVMRGMFHTDHLPLGLITTVAVAQVLAVNAGGKRYVSPVIGYTAREVLRARRGPRDAEQPKTPADSYPLFVEERIRHLAAEHRALHGPTEEPVRRTWAWPEIAGVAVGALALVVWALA